jgi:predicted DNA-binding WGR domain protein
MPRFEKVGRGKAYFCEVLFDTTRVFVAQGERGKDETTWRMKASDRRTYGFRTEPAKAQPFYDGKLAELGKKGFKPAGAATPECDAMRAKLADAPKPSAETESTHQALQQQLAAGKVYWVGKKPSNADQFVEISVEGTTVIQRKGTIGKKGRAEKETHANPAAALFSGATSLNIVSKFGFGPPE